MMKITINIFAGFLLGLFLIFLPVLSVQSATPTSQPTVEVNSFELFWPVSAGKTMVSNIYFLKLWKENLRGSLIFSKARKIDYLTFQSVKRLVEAEALLVSGKGELANKTLDLTVDRLNKAESIMTSARGEEVFKNIATAVTTRLENMTKFANWLKIKYPGSSTKLEQVLISTKSLEKMF